MHKKILSPILWLMISLARDWSFAISLAVMAVTPNSVKSENVVTKAKLVAYIP